ncbi:hypothetical protein CFK37_09235 [Virgibacillus phasianinus]|uniref:Uncharacterized protein n=2 Tax=Virgibacillus phasianinus TaxID=2017483 RepID=A0A220U890_9BACI|nr:hypothetical protein CFK37_09235 [Virgibacillus phasianinus]
MVLAILLLFSSLPGTVSAKDVNKRDADNREDFEPGDEVTVKVATYNTHAGIGVDGRYDLDRIADTIRESGAEIIGLQEVDVHWGGRSQYENEIKILADKLNMNYFFAPIYNLDPPSEGSPRRQYGVAVLSKYPILNAENHNIARLSTQDPNPSPRPAPGFLEAQIHVLGEEVWFYVTHLDYRPDPTVREMQIEDMLEIMSGHSNSLLVGDMNASPDSPELDPLFQQFGDAWAMTHENPGYTYPSHSPIKRIDYLFTTPGMEVESAHIFQSKASDHLPVTSDVTFELGSHPFDAAGLSSLIDYFKEAGEFASDDAIRALKLHLAVVSQYEEKEQGEKVIEHMKGFKVLLDHQEESGLLSGEAYEILRNDADYLIRGWQ